MRILDHNNSSPSRFAKQKFFSAVMSIDKKRNKLRQS